MKQTATAKTDGNGHCSKKECDETITSTESHQQDSPASADPCTSNALDGLSATAADKAETKQELETIDDSIFIVLRGFPGAGKSTLCRAIKAYYADSNCIACSYDKYHWSGNDDGKGEFKFNPSIHKQSKQWCREELMQSFQNNVAVIIADNAHFEKWEYAKFITVAQTYHYRVLVIEIRSETPHIARTEHMQHMQQEYRHKQCLLCRMQHERCKMRVADHILKVFINKYESDANAIVVDPKLDASEKWATPELKKLLSTKVVIDLNEYTDDAYYEQQSYKKHYPANKNYNQRGYQSRRNKKRSLEAVENGANEWGPQWKQSRPHNARWPSNNSNSRYNQQG